MGDELKISPQLYLQKQVGGQILSALPDSLLIKASIENALKPTCVISNVIGPPFQCTMAKYAINDINFLATGPLGLYIGILSYNNKMRISFTTDALANIDSALLRECVENAYDDLRKKVMSEPGNAIHPPDMTPTSAKVLEYFMLPVLLSMFV